MNSIDVKYRVFEKTGLNIVNFSRVESGTVIDFFILDALRNSVSVFERENEYIKTVKGAITGNLYYVYWYRSVTGVVEMFIGME